MTKRPLSADWRHLLFLPLIAVFAYFSFSGARHQAVRAIEHLRSSEQEQFSTRTGGWSKIIREVQWRVPEGDLFREEQETVYKDDCCHLNQRGYQAMAREMANRIGGSEAPDANADGR